MADVTLKVPTGRSVKRVNYRKPSSVVELHVNKADSVAITIGEPPVVIPPPPSNQLEKNRLDWIARSTADGVCQAVDFRTDAEVDPYKFANGMLPNVLARVTRFTDDGIAGTGGACLQLATPADAADTNSQAWWCRMNRAWTDDKQGFGTTEFWQQHRIKIPASRLIKPTGETAAGGWKWSITSNEHSSNPISLVLQDGYYRGWPSAYPHNNSHLNGDTFEKFFKDMYLPSSNNIDINLLPGFDRGTGAPFDQAGYQDRYCAYQNNKGCPFWATDVWVTIIERTHIRTFGGKTGNEYDLMYALPLDTEYRPLILARDFEIGSLTDECPNGHCRKWFTPYETGRNKPGAATWMRITQYICSLKPIAIPKDDPMIIFHGGSGIATPTWKPAAGVRANLTSNTMQDVDAESNPLLNPNYPAAAPWRGDSGLAACMAYSGSIFATHLGQFGSVIKGGSGDTAYSGNDLYAVDTDAATPEFFILKDPWYPLYPVNQGSGDCYAKYGTGTGSGEYFGDSGGSTTLPHQPSGFQEYATSVVLPPGVGGAGVNGAILTPFRQAMATGSFSSTRAHIFDLAVGGRTWERFSANDVSGGTYLGVASAVSVSRDAVYMVNQQFNAIAKLALATGGNPAGRLFSNISLSHPDGDFQEGDYGRLMYWAAQDLLLFIRVQSGVTYLWVIDLVTNTVTKPGITGTGPSVGNGSADFNEITGNIAYFTAWGGDENTWFRLTPTGNPRSAAWAWTSAAITGAATTNYTSTSQYSRMWISQAAGCSYWLGTWNNPLQVIGYT